MKNRHKFYYKTMLCLCLLFVSSYAYAQQTSVRQGKQYINKYDDQVRINDLLNDASTLLGELEALETSLSGELDTLEAQYNALVPEVCTGDQKSFWDGSAWVCSDDFIGTFTTSGDWTQGAWGSCSATCGGGTQTRSVTCGFDTCTGTKPATSQSCNTQACATTGAWTKGAWSAWSTCSATCGGGTQTRTRSVTCSYTTCTGQPASSETQDCNTQACATASCIYNINDSYVSYSAFGATNFMSYKWQGVIVSASGDSVYTYSQGVLKESNSDWFGTNEWYEICRTPK